MMPKRFSFLFSRGVCLAALGLPLMFGCSKKSAEESPSIALPEKQMPALTVVAPHVFKRALVEVDEAFLKEHPGASFDLKNGMVNEMVGEIAAGKLRGHILVIMGGPEMRSLAKGGVVDTAAARHVADVGSIIAAPKGNPKRITSLQDLARDDVGPIAFPNPETDSSGAAFAAALRKEGLWDKMCKKAVASASPHQACTIAEAGKADVGVTYVPCVLFGHSKMTLCIAAFLPKSEDTEMRVLAVPYKDSPHPLAKAYLDYLLSPKAQAIFGKYAFEPVRAPSPKDAEKSLFVPCGAGMLLAYLNFSRCGDLSMPGEAFYIDLAAKRGFVAERRTVVYFLPVIMVQKGNPKNIKGLADMTRPGIKVAIGDPEALAVGPVTQRILQRAGIADAVAKNVTMMAGCIPELANAISMRTADVTIAWDAVAFQHRKHADTIPIPLSEYNEVAEVVIATLTCSKQPEEA